MTVIGKYNYVAGLKLIGTKLDFGSFNYAEASHVVIGPGVRNAVVTSSNLMLLKGWDEPRDRIYDVDDCTLMASHADDFYCVEISDVDLRILHREGDVYWTEHIEGSELSVSIIDKETFEGNVHLRLQ